MGRSMEMQEMCILLCHFVYKLDFRFPDGYNPFTQLEAMEDRHMLRLGPLPATVTQAKLSRCRNFLVFYNVMHYN
jgi:hypothetical protein